MSQPRLVDEETWVFPERSPERAFADEVDRALQAHSLALAHLVERHPGLDALQLVGFLEDIGNRYLDLSDALGATVRRKAHSASD